MSNKENKSLSQAFINAFDKMSTQVFGKADVTEQTEVQVLEERAYVLEQKIKAAYKGGFGDLRTLKEERQEVVAEISQKTAAANVLRGTPKGAEQDVKDVEKQDDIIERRDRGGKTWTRKMLRKEDAYDKAFATEELAEKFASAVSGVVENIEGMFYVFDKESLQEAASLDLAKKVKALDDETDDKKSDAELDAVNPKAVKKKFKDRKDKDIDNDGDVDDSDEYLHKRRKAISKAVSKKSVDEATSKAQLRALANVKAQPKGKVSLAKAPWDKKDKKEEVELDEAMKLTHALIDTADGNKVKAMASSEKGIKQSMTTAHLPPMSVKSKNTLKIVTLTKPVSQKASEKMVGYPLAKGMDKFPTNTSATQGKMMGENLDEAKQVLAHGGKGQYKAVGGDGTVDVKYKGKVVATGDFDRGADGWFISFKGQKGQKFFDDAQKMVDFLAKNKITEVYESVDLDAAMLSEISKSKEGTIRIIDLSRVHPDNRMGAKETSGFQVQRMTKGKFVNQGKPYKSAKDAEKVRQDGQHSMQFEQLGEDTLTEAKSKNMIYVGHPDDYTDPVWKHEVYINGRKVTSGDEFKLNGKTFQSVDAFIRALSKKYNVPEDSFDLYEFDDNGKNPKLYSTGFVPRKNVREDTNLTELTAEEKRLVSTMYDKKGNLTAIGKKVMDHGKKNEELDEVSGAAAVKLGSGNAILRDPKTGKLNPKGKMGGVKQRPALKGRGATVEESIAEAVRRKKAPKIQGDSIKIQRAQDKAHADAMGRHVASGRRKSVKEAKNDYTISHKTFSSAVQHAAEVVKKQGYEIPDDEWDQKVAMGPRKPGSGKTNSYAIDLMKGGKETRRKLQMQVYHDQGRYELNMYVS